MTMLQQVRQLLDLITKSVDTLEQACIESDTQLPGLDEPFQSNYEAFWANLVVAETTSVISAAALHLNAMVSPPRNILHYAVGGHLKSAAMRMCFEGNVTEILREAGPDGLRVDDITAKNGLDAQKLARCLRLLATNHIYREVQPDVFANNRISSYFDTMKPSAEIIADPHHKHDNTMGLTAVMGHALDEHFKASAYLWESASDPKTAKSEEPTDTPFAKAVGNGKTFWDWIEQPEEFFRRRRFDAGMHGAQGLITDMMISAYDWKSLPAKALVVDVGGGVGSASLALAKEFPDLRIVVQDRQPAIANGIEVWTTELPAALLFGRVQFQPHDFFTAQLQRNASIFLLKNVLHCWSDKYCSKILEQLRDAASPSTKLICLEMILPYACRDKEGNGTTAGASSNAPKPLLANWGSVNDFVYLSDIAMLILSNSQERTMRHFKQLLRCAGWKITAVRRQLGPDVSPLSSIEAVPI